jgi:small conductance mechanosensitive channel
MSAPPARTGLAEALAVVVGLICAGILLYYAVLVLHAIPSSLTLLVRLAITLALGIAAIIAVERILARVLNRYAGPARTSLIVSFYRLTTYTLLALALLLVAGVSSLAVLAGGTFAGLVIGLAGQTVLANVIAGVMLLFVRPLEPGERVTLTTWQYGMIAPGYPPKFYSQDLVVPGFTGIVQEVGIVYTVLQLDDGPRMKVPNSIIVQAAVLSHRLGERWVRTKYELAPDLDPASVIEAIRTRLAANPWVIRPDEMRIYLTSVTLTSSVIAVDALCRGSFEDGPRSSILLDLRLAVNALRPPASSRPGRGDPANPGAPKK